MFTKIKLQNFRSFDQIELDLTTKNNTPKNLVFIYGENGVGKSNLISAFVLLSELLATMDFRDTYEEILNQKAFMYDEKMEKMLREKLMSGLRDIQAIIDDFRMVGSNEPIIAEYEFYIGGNIGKYSIKLGDNEILHERLEYLLNKRRGVYFDCSKENISINSNIITNKEFLSDIKETAKRFWGKHSILAIIDHEMHDKSASFGIDSISANFYDVLAEFGMMSSNVKMGVKWWSNLCAPIKILEKPVSGKIARAEEDQLDVAEKIFTQFFSSINSDINNVFYKRVYNDKYIEYQLFFEKLISGTYRNIPFSKESTGNHQLLRVLCYTLCACLGVTVIIDEADAGIHDVLFQKIMIETEPQIDGQLIITTHNTMTMETDFARDAVYVFQEDEDRHKRVRCITDYEKRTYFNNNIRNKYLNNEYGGLPAVKKIDYSASLKLLLDNLKSHLDEE